MLDQQLHAAQTAIRQGDYTTAEEMVSALEALPQFEEETRLLKTQLEAVHRFLKEFQNRDYDAINATLDLHPELISLPPFQELIGAFKEEAGQVLALAADGEVAEVLDRFEPFLAMEYFRHKIAGIVKIGYLYQIRKAIENEEAIQWEETLSEYIKRFAKDPEITRIIQELRLQDYFPQTGDPEGYLHHGLPDTILHVIVN